MAFLADQDRALALRCFGLGMDLEEVAGRLRLPPARLRRWLQQGATAARGWQRDFWLDVTARQGAYREEVLQGLLTQAKTEPAAARMAIERIERATATASAEAIPDDPLEAKRHRLRDIRRRMVEAGDTAYSKLMREERQLMVEIAQMELEAEKARKARGSLRAVTTAEASQKLRARLAELPDGDLADLAALALGLVQERGLDVPCARAG